jgi:hypothetical protein
MSNIVMTLDDILTQWETDATIDYEDLGRESIRTPILHAKYLRHLVDARQGYRKEEKRMAKVLQLRSRYYNGELSKEELEKQGWDPYQYVKPIKAELEKLLNADTIVNIQRDNIRYYEYMMETLESILSALQRRTWDVKSAVEYRRFTSGV